jgi:hypothetical protein
LPVWYRVADETAWHAGITESVSSSGAVIRGDAPRDPSQAVIVAIALPSGQGCLVGRGSIVRTVERSTRTTPATFAIAVKRYRIDRCKSVLSKLTPQPGVGRRVSASSHGAMTAPL